MRPDFAQTPEADVAMPAQLFAIGKTALHRFLAAFINSFAVIFITMGVYFIFIVLPDVAGDEFDIIEPVK